MKLEGTKKFDDVNRNNVNRGDINGGITVEDKNFEDTLNDAINKISEISPANTNEHMSSVKKKMP